MFQFFTFDYMINENLEPQLIEVNGSPSWVTNNDIYKELKVELLTGIMDLVLFLHQDSGKTEELVRNFE